MEDDDGVGFLGRAEGEADVAIGVEPILSYDVQDCVPVKPCWPGTRRSLLINVCHMYRGHHAYSFKGAMAETTFGLFANMLAIVIIILSVRCTFVALECHPGKLNLWPELSKLYIYSFRSRCEVH